MYMKKVPMRMCIACREMHPKKSLVRIVSSKEDGVFVDSTGKKSGKGA
ncbi:MAG: YlxR family protein, partial [Clostridiales bacterium]|nr:YlxR family protein [Clostridiales bacterium]